MTILMISSTVLVGFFAKSLFCCKTGYFSHTLMFFLKFLLIHFFQEVISNPDTLICSFSNLYEKLQQEKNFARNSFMMDYYLSTSFHFSSSSRALQL